MFTDFTFALPSTIFALSKLLAIGGSVLKEICQAYFVELIAVVSTLLRNVKIQLCFEDMTDSIFRGS